MKPNKQCNEIEVVDDEKLNQVHDKGTKTVKLVNHNKVGTNRIQNIKISEITKLDDKTSVDLSIRWRRWWRTG